MSFLKNRFSKPISVMGLVIAILVILFTSYLLTNMSEIKKQKEKE